MATMTVTVTVTDRQVRVVSREAGRVTERWCVDIAPGMDSESWAMACTGGTVAFASTTETRNDPSHG